MVVNLLTFVRQCASHFYGSTFEKALGAGVTGRFPNDGCFQGGPGAGPELETRTGELQVRVVLLLKGHFRDMSVWRWFEPCFQDTIGAKIITDRNNFSGQLFGDR